MRGAAGVLDRVFGTGAPGRGDMAFGTAPVRAAWAVWGLLLGCDAATPEPASAEVPVVPVAASEPAASEPGGGGGAGGGARAGGGAEGGASAAALA